MEMKIHLCSLCPKVFDRPDNLSRHVNSNHEQNKILCHQCGKGFARFGNLKCHVDSCKATAGKIKIYSTT